MTKKYTTPCMFTNQENKYAYKCNKYINQAFASKMSTSQCSVFSIFLQHTLKEDGPNSDDCTVL